MRGFQKPLKTRFHSLLIKNEVDLLKKGGEPFEPQDISQEIVNSCLYFLLNRKLNERILGELYSKKLKTTGEELHPLIVEIVVEEWDKMGQERQRVFGEKGRRAISELQAGLSHHEKRR